MDDKVLNERFDRWYSCSLCEQRYHGVVACALGWACWKTYVGRPETDQLRGVAMNQLGNGLHYAQRHTESLVVREAELAMLRRLGAPKEHILDTQSNLAGIYLNVGRDEEASRVLRDVYAGRLKLDGEEAFQTLVAASNYANSLDGIERFEEAKPLLRKTIPVARRTLGESHDLTLRMTWNYARTLCEDTGATLVDLREAVTTLEDSERIARRVLGGAHPTTEGLQISLRKARAVLRARETPPGTTR